jgi:hypothetical protein
MIEFYKFILSKVAFDKSLFLKEIRKSIKGLNSVDLVSFQIWCYREFGSKYQRELDLAFIAVR